MQAPRLLLNIDEGLRPLLRLCRETVVRLQKTENALVRSLEVIRC
jgi:hypothetical protein